MIRIEIRSTEVNVKDDVSKRTGRAYYIKEQHGLVTLPSGEVRRVALSLEKEDAPLDPGMYEPLASAYYVGDFDSLAISMRRRHWQRVEAPAVRKVG